MKQFGFLYRGYFRKISAPYLFVLLTYLVLSATLRWVIPPAVWSPQISNALMMQMNYSSLVLLLFFAALPILYSLSFKDEKMAKTDLQWFSFPVRRSTVVFSRYMAAFTFLMISIAVGLLWSFLMAPIMMQEMKESIGNSGSARHLQVYAEFIPFYNDYWRFLVYINAYFFRTELFAFCSFVLLGVVTFAQSLGYAWRFKGFLRNLIVFILFFGFCLLGFRGNDFSHTGLLAGSAVVNCLVAGVLLFCAGLFIFEKYGEA